MMVDLFGKDSTEGIEALAALKLIMQPPPHTTERDIVADRASNKRSRLMTGGHSSCL